MYDALIMAKKNNFDVFNALDLMEVCVYISNIRLSFHLHYYL